MPQKGKYRPPQRRDKKQPGQVTPQNIQTSQAEAPQVSPAASAPAGAQRPPAAVPKPFARPLSKPGSGPQLPMAKERYPYLTTELKWIGIAAVVIVVLLIVMAVVIPPIFA